MTATVDRVHAAIAPALDVYGQELARHSTLAGPQVVMAALRTVYGPVRRGTPGQAFVGACACGWRARRASTDRGTANRSAGLHLAAAWKRAGRTCDAAMDALLAGAR